MIAASRTAQLPVGDERLSSFDLHTFSEPRSLQRTEAFGRLTIFAGAGMKGLPFYNVGLTIRKPTLDPGWTRLRWNGVQTGEIEVI